MMQIIKDLDIPAAAPQQHAPRNVNALTPLQTSSAVTKLNFNQMVKERAAMIPPKKKSEMAEIAASSNFTCLPIDLRLYILGFLQRVLAPMQFYDSYVLGRFLDDDTNQWHLLYPHGLCLAHGELDLSLSKKNTRWRLILSQVESLEIEVRKMDAFVPLVHAVSAATAPNLRSIDIVFRNDFSSHMSRSDSSLQAMDYKAYFWSLVRKHDTGNRDLFLQGVQDVLAHMPRLQHLTVNRIYGSNQVADLDLQIFVKHRNLRSLELSVYNGPDLVPLVTALHDMHITSLSLRLSFGTDTIPLLEQLQDVDSIREISIENVSLFLHVTDEMFALPRRVTKCILKEFSAKSWSNLKHLSDLTCLEITVSKHQELCAYNHWEALISLSCLKHLKLHNFSKYHDWGCLSFVLKKLIQTANLVSVDLRFMDVMPSLNEVQDLCLQKLETLCLGADLYHFRRIPKVGRFKWTYGHVFDLLFSVPASLRSLSLVTRNYHKTAESVDLDEETSNCLVSSGLYNHVQISLH